MSGSSSARSVVGVSYQTIAWPTLVVQVAVTEEPLPRERLTAAETVQVERLKDSWRQREWLMGRHALKALRHQLDGTGETADIRFPSARFSISHSEHYAVAVAVVDGVVAGVGVDLEEPRVIRPEARRFYLREDEAAAASDADLLRIWTAKEAVFKADPDNRDRGLRDYTLLRPEVRDGDAVCRSAEPQGGPKTFRYRILDLGKNTLAIAFCCSREFEEK